MSLPLSERQQLKLLLRTTAPSTTVSALNTPISPTRYLTWSTARRRAWDRRHSSPNNYFLHYLHPTFSPRPPKWSLEEHLILLAALRRAPPSDQWGLFSLLVPGRIGSDCRRYYNRIGRAGFITLEGHVKHRLVSKAKVMDGKNVLESNNPLFLSRSLRKFVPRNLPQIDDVLYSSLEKPSSKKRLTSKPATTRPNRDPGKRKDPGNTRDTKLPASSSAKPGFSEQKLTSRSPPQSLTPALSLGSPALSTTPNIVDTHDLLTYIPAKPSEYDGQPPSDHEQNNVYPTTAIQEKTKAVPCRVRVRESNAKNQITSSLKSKTRSKHKTGAFSHGTSRRIRDALVKAGSVKVKIRTKFPASGPCSVKEAQLGVTAGPKRKESHKNRKMKKSVQMSSKNEKKRRKGNCIPGQSLSSYQLDNPEASVKKAESIEALPGSSKQDESDISKQSRAIGLPSCRESARTGDNVKKLTRQSFKPLRPILKSKDASKKKRENTKTVHFSRTEDHGQEAPAWKELVCDEAVIPDQKSNEVSVVFQQKEALTGQTSIDGELSSNHETNLELNKTNDTSRCTPGASAYEHVSLAASDSGRTDHVRKHQAASVPSVLVSCSPPDKGPRAQLPEKEKALVEKGSFSSKAFPKSPCSNETTTQVQLGFADMCSAAEREKELGSGQHHGHMPAIRSAAPEPLHVGSYAEEPEKPSFAGKSQKRVETIQREQSTSGTGSQGSGTDGELMDLEVEMGTLPRNPTENEGNLEETVKPTSQVGNSRRVSGPTRGDRTSISFLMNGENASVQHKKRKHEEVEASADDGVCGNFERAVSLISSDRDAKSKTTKEGCKDSRVEDENTLVLNNAGPKAESEYKDMQKRVEQTRLMLRLFVDVVDPIGEKLGHKRQRLNLLESFDESLRWLRFTEGNAAKKRPLSIPSLFGAAKTAFDMDNRNTGNTGTHSKIHVGGLSLYWGEFVDGYIERLKEMENRQNMEVESRRIVDSIF